MDLRWQVSKCLATRVVTQKSQGELHRKGGLQAGVTLDYDHNPTTEATIKRSPTKTKRGMMKPVRSHWSHFPESLESLEVWAYQVHGVLKKRIDTCAIIKILGTTILLKPESSKRLERQPQLAFTYTGFDCDSHVSCIRKRRGSPPRLPPHLKIERQLSR